MILIFDLDDTLYPEIQFAISGFKAVANYVYLNFGVPAEESFQILSGALDLGERDQAFQKLILSKSLPKGLIRKLIAVYRSHKPEIKLDEVVTDVFKMYSDISKYIVTDGNKLVQRNKIKALGLDNIVKRSFVTHSFGLNASKPSLICFEKIKHLEKVEWKDLIYVGDDPKKDFVNLKPLGVTTVRVLSGRHSAINASEEFDAEFHISGFEELVKVLDSRYEP